LERFDEAIRCSSKALEISPKDPDVNFAWNNQGICLYRLGRFKEAIESFVEFLKINPNYPYAWYYRGLAEDQLGFSNEAVVAFRKFIEFAPGQEVQCKMYARKRLKELEGR